jgi:hypothetical protein
MRGLMGLWLATWNMLFTEQQYNLAEYRLIHKQSRRSLLEGAMSSTLWSSSETVCEEPAAKKCQSLIDDNAGLQLFTRGMFRYRGELFHSTAGPGEWALVALSLFPWKRCKYPHVVKVLKNYKLGGTPRNEAQGTTLAVFTEVPREQKPLVDHLIGAGWATLTTGIAHVEGFDKVLLRSSNHVSFSAIECIPRCPPSSTTLTPPSQSHATHTPRPHVSSLQCLIYCALTVFSLCSHCARAVLSIS